MERNRVALLVYVLLLFDLGIPVPRPDRSSSRPVRAIRASAATS
jgi:hypothetical protein